MPFLECDEDTLGTFLTFTSRHWMEHILRKEVSMLTFSEYLNEARTKTDVSDSFNKLTYREYSGMIRRQNLSVYEIPESKLSLMSKHPFSCVLFYEGKKDGKKVEFFGLGRLKSPNGIYYFNSYENGIRVNNYFYADDEDPSASEMTKKEFEASAIAKTTHAKLKKVFILVKQETADEYKHRKEREIEPNVDDIMKFLGI